jgi:hypothetical protein
MSLLDRLRAFFRPSAPPSAPRRLYGRSKALLAASFNILPDEEPGWITIMEARLCFRRSATHTLSASWMRRGRTHEPAMSFRCDVVLGCPWMNAPGTV